MNKKNLITEYLRVSETILLELYCKKSKSGIINYLLSKIYDLIKYIKEKINTNSYILLANIEYLKHKNMFVDLIYAILFNKKEILSIVNTIIKNFRNFLSKLIKGYYIFSLKILLSFMVEYVKKNEEFYIDHKKILTFGRRFIRGILHLVRFISGLGTLLCFLRYI